MDKNRHPIQLVARLTGLTPFVIRIWEQRYRAVQPARTPTNRRLYSDADVRRLQLLRELAQGGYAIGQIASMPDVELQKLSGGVAPAPHAAGPQPVMERISTCTEAIRSFNGPAFEGVLKEALADFGGLGFLQRLVAPLSQKIGQLWREGEITAAHEHFATGILRNHLLNLAKPFGGLTGAPRLVVGTPAGQVHDLGAVLVGAIAAHLGWQVTQLGCSLPAAEIAGAARQTRARAVALSIVFPEDDADLPGELLRLRELLLPDTAVLAGGRAMRSYRAVLERIGAIMIDEIAEIGAALDHLRTTTLSGRAA
jgi:DNA-binding transcriptional MerR regulator/methylmalonyl-CoA mutase cobalamin-binding subunit